MTVTTLDSCLLVCLSSSCWSCFMFQVMAPQAHPTSSMRAMSMRIGVGSLTRPSSQTWSIRRCSVVVVVFCCVLTCLSCTDPGSFGWRRGERYRCCRRCAGRCRLCCRLCPTLGQCASPAVPVLIQKAQEPHGQVFVSDMPPWARCARVFFLMAGSDLKSLQTSSFSERRLVPFSISAQTSPM